MALKILLVDDDRTSLTFLKSRLEERQYVVASACDGDIGLESVKREKPDLIILDVEMPRMNGYTFITELRKLDNGKSIPVLVLTAHSEHQPIFGFKGIKGYLIKPVNVEVLLKEISNAIGGTPPVQKAAQQ